MPASALVRDGFGGTTLSLSLGQSLVQSPIITAVKWLIRNGIKISGLELFAQQLLAVAALIALRRLFWFYRRIGRRLRRALASGIKPSARKVQQLRNARSLGKCRDYATFKSLGEQLDVATGKEPWKRDDNHKYFDVSRIRQRTESYTQFMEEGDVEGCMFALRQELLRKHFGVCNPALFEVTAAGTKVLVEEYIHTVCEAMNWVAFAHRDADPSSSADQVSAVKKLAFFNETKHSFGRSALLLSGGASLGMYHFGVVKALHLNDFLPRIISGTSAGAIVCGSICVRKDDELMEMWEAGYEWEKNWALQFLGDISVKRFVEKRGASLYSAEFLGEALKKNIGEYTFLEAFDRTGRICNITVSGLPGTTQYPMLLNYLTSPHVLIWSAASCSAAVPGIFEPAELLAKDRFGQICSYLPSGLKWRDGSMQNDLPMSRLGELFNVNYFIVSQVNPHAQLMTGGGFGSASGPIYRASQFLRRELKQYLLSMSSFIMGTQGRVAPWLRPVGFSAVGLVAQEYEGDVTIYNGNGLIDMFNGNLLVNATEEMMRRYTMTSEWETWWHMPQIENACAIEFVIDEIVKDLREELMGQGSPKKESPPARERLLQRKMSRDFGVCRLPSWNRHELEQLTSKERGSRLQASVNQPGRKSSGVPDSKPKGLGTKGKPNISSSQCLLSLQYIEAA